MNTERGYCTLLVTILLVLLSNATASGAPARVASLPDKILNVALSGNPVTMDPLIIEDALSLSVVSNNVYETLARYTSGKISTIEPSLAVSWEVRQTGREWIFQIRDGVRFHDGTLLTADDVVSSFERYTGFNGRVEKVGPLSVRFFFDDKMANFDKTTTDARFSIVKILNDGRIIGTGPFMVTEWDPTRKIVLESFDMYWGGRPNIDEVVFHCSTGHSEAMRMIKRGEIDVIDIIPPSMTRDFKRIENVVLSTLEGVNISYVHINIARPPLDNPEFREALNMLIDTDRMIREVYWGEAVPCRGLLPPVLGGLQEGPPRILYDPIRAKRTIDRLLGGKKCRLTMLGLPFPRPYSPEPERLASLIKEFLESAGIEIDYKPTGSMSEYLEIFQKRQFDLALSGWVIESRNPDDLFRQLFGVGGGTSAGLVTLPDDRFESLILMARRTISLNKQHELYSKATDIFFENYPWIMLAHTNQTGAYRKGITGLSFSPTGELRAANVQKEIIVQ